MGRNKKLFEGPDIYLISIPQKKGVKFVAVPSLKIWKEALFSPLTWREVKELVKGSLLSLSVSGGIVLFYYLFYYLLLK